MHKGDADGGGGEACFKISITNSQAGKLIGRQGHGKDKIETATGAQISISRGRTEERAVSMEGARDSVIACASEVLHAIFGGDADCEHALDLLIPNEVCGHIYGRQGREIKQMQHNSGCTLEERTDTDAGCPAAERVFTAAGVLDGLVHLCQLVISVMARSGVAMKTRVLCTCEHCAYRPLKPKTICRSWTYCKQATCPFAHARYGGAGELWSRVQD